MNILILEDHLNISEVLFSVFHEIFPLALIDTAYTILEAEIQLEKKRYDLISIDIQLPDGNGLTLAKSIRDSVLNRRAYLFIVTGNTNLEVAFEAYDQTKCFKFIMKPVQREVLILALQNLKEDFLREDDTQYFTYENKTFAVRIPLNEIRYIEVANKNCTVFTLNDQILLGRVALAKIIENFSEKQLVQIHRSFVINTDCVRKIHYGALGWKIELDGISTSLPVGIKYQNDLRALINKK